MRTKLTEFKDACSDELAASNEMIVKQYDIWYSLIPFKSAICVTDTNAQDYCLLKASSSSSSTSKTRRSDVSYAARHLTNTVHKRAQTVLMPNVDTYRNSHLMYLFTSPDMDAAQLCTPCTQKIVAKYIGFEYATPYALGLNKSPLLGGQAPLWAAMQEKCSSDFTETITKTAGVATADQFSGGPATTAASSFTTLAAAFAAAVFALF
ncbi:hypothetical protein OPQ81_007204 [Rhizoctonia solani]|nr:hypothetical protein OPQ81_007204 [Rhizoctonia solani]